MANGEFDLDDEDFTAGLKWGFHLGWIFMLVIVTFFPFVGLGARSLLGLSP